MSWKKTNIKILVKYLEIFTEIRTAIFKCYLVHWSMKWFSHDSAIFGAEKEHCFGILYSEWSQGALVEREREREI